MFALANHPDIIIYVIYMNCSGEILEFEKLQVNAIQLKKLKSFTTTQCAPKPQLWRPRRMRKSNFLFWKFNYSIIFNKALLPNSFRNLF
jgi:undecaprenyl pyrophosphate synthase